MTMLRNQHLMGNALSRTSTIKAEMIYKSPLGNRNWKISYKGIPLFSFQGNLHDIHNVQELNGHVMISYALINLETGKVSDAVKVFKKEPCAYKALKMEDMGITTKNVKTRQGIKTGYFLGNNPLFVSSETYHIMNVKKFGQFFVVEYALQMPHVKKHKDGTEEIKGHVLESKKTSVFKKSATDLILVRGDCQRVDYSQPDSENPESCKLDIIVGGKVVQTLISEIPSKEHIKEMYNRAIQIRLFPAKYLGKNSPILTR